MAYIQRRLGVWKLRVCSVMIAKSTEVADSNRLGCERLDGGPCQHLPRLRATDTGSLQVSSDHKGRESIVSYNA